MQKIMNIFLIFLSLVMLPLCAQSTERQTISLGVLAHRGEAKAKKLWQPTVDYLNQHINSVHFQLVPLKLKPLRKGVAKAKFEFVLTNPGNYVELEALYGITRIATLRNLRQGKPYDAFGSVIFTRKGREDIQQLEDIKGKTFAGVKKQAFGAFQVAWYEFQKKGIDPFSDFKKIIFTGIPQDKVVYAVRDGEADMGTVRTDILERMVQDKLININDFKIINAKAVEGFPFWLSSELYPEWAFAQTPTTPKGLGKLVAQALLQMPADHPAAIAGKHAGYEIPGNYNTIHEMYKALKYGPYEHFGEFGLSDVLVKYWPVFILFLALITFGIYHILFISKMARKLTIAKKNLADANDELEKRNVKLRRLSCVDGLTGISNRRTFDEFIKQEWCRARRKKSETEISLLMMDIDFFKTYNDGYGHQQGDDCLQKVSSELKKGIKRDCDLIARYGGEEFVAVLPDTPLTDAIKIAEQLRESVFKLSLPHEFSKTGEFVTLSLGISMLIPSADNTPEQLIKAADEALYQAKENGRNQVAAAPVQNNQ